MQANRSCAVPSIMRSAIVIPPNAQPGEELKYSLPDHGSDYAVIMRPVDKSFVPIPCPWVRCGTFATRASARRSIRQGGIASYLKRWRHQHPDAPGVKFVILPVRWEGVPFEYHPQTDNESLIIWFN
jgi:hypothetical protein